MREAKEGLPCRDVGALALFRPKSLFDTSITQAAGAAFQRAEPRIAKNTAEDVAAGHGFG
ncbi:MAG: hypothetical protein KatS3mg024_0357 [Armatimonadota bacterium]|nr:MAG: hypothetical protein KatS3mg024_0357 [Armatimonadota bacterium]